MLSIVMPTFNQGRYIRESLDSVLAQTYENFELVIVNDGSTDETPAILDEYADPRIRRIDLNRKPGVQGPGRALNVGFGVTQGDYETWWASDNVMFPHCLETLVRFLEGHREVDFVYGNCEIRTMDAAGERIAGVKNLLAEVRNQEWSLSRFLNHYFLGICWIWQRRIRAMAGYWHQEEPCEDYDMALRMALVGGVFQHIPDCLGWFRRHKTNLSNAIKGTPHEPTSKSNMAFAIRFLQKHGLPDVLPKEAAETNRAFLRPKPEPGAGPIAGIVFE